MSADVERNLISKILQTRDLTQIVEAGIKPKFFLDGDHRQVYMTILDHQANYSVVPALETFKKDYPTYQINPAEEPIAYYIDEIREDYKYFVFDNALADVVDLVDEQRSVDVAMARMAKAFQEINTDVSPARVIDVTRSDENRFDRYKAYALREGSLRGIPTGFPTLDQVTLGWQPGQLNVFVGPPKAGKSTMMLLSSIASHLCGYESLFMGFEMSNEEQEERYDSMRAGVSHQNLRAGALSSDDMEKIRQSMLRDREMPPMILTEDAGSLTVSGVASYIDRFNPAVAFVDGVYMMEDERGEKKGSPQALTNMTRDLKQLAKNLKIPIVISTQVLGWKMSKTKGVTVDSIGYSSSFGQDADNLVAVERTDEEDVNKLKVLLSRNSPGIEWYMTWDWDVAKFEEMQDPTGERPERAYIAF